ncbi:chromate transporter [soil metagenome]
MKLSTHLLLLLGLQLAGLSFLTFGGVNAVLPEIHRLVVEDTHWMTGAEFAAMFAIGQAAPGPNVLVITLIGWKLAGLTGAIVTTLALTAPACLLTYFVIQLLERYRTAPWRIRFQAAVVPVTVGFIASTAWLISRTVDTNAWFTAMTLLTAAVCIRTRLNPLWMLGAGGVLGALLTLG